MRLKILSWNIHKGIGGFDRKYSLERVAEAIRQTEPDIALLQEVADGWPPANHDLQAELLAEMTGLTHIAFAPEHRFREGGYGNAILSRFPLADRHRVDLKIGWRKQRSALQASVLLPQEAPSRKIVVTSLHLGLAESERRRQLARLFGVEQLMQIDAPAIVGGDFNDVFGGLESRFLSEQGFTRAVPRLRSFPAVAPVFCLDGLFVRGLSNTSGGVVSDATARAASDHLPLLGVVELTEPESGG